MKCKFYKHKRFSKSKAQIKAQVIPIVFIISILFILATPLIILTASVYVMLPENVRIDVGKTYSTFKVWEDNSWVLAGQEYTLMFDGTKKMRASSREVEHFVDGEIIKIVRTANFKNNVTVIDTYTFDGNEKDIKLFPISHEINVLNGEGYILVYEVTKLDYSGETIKDISSPQEFGHKMRIEWEDGNYYSRIWGYSNRDEGKLTVKYRPDSKDFTKQVKLFDPPSKEGKTSITPNVFKRWSNPFYSGNESALYKTASFIGDTFCLAPNNKWLNPVIREENNLSAKIDYSKVEQKEEDPIYEKKNVTYDYPGKIYYSEGKDKFFILGKEEYCFILDRAKRLHKWGLQTIIISAEAGYNSTDVNVTQENKFAHLNLTDETMILYLPFDVQEDVADNITYDYSNYNNDGTVNGTTTYISSGRYGGAYTFNNVATEIITSQNINLTNSNFTFTAWVNPRTGTFSANPRIMGQTNSLYFGITASGSLQMGTAGLSDNYASSGSNTINVEEWSFVVAQYNGTNKNFYINGDFAGGDTANGSLIPPRQDMGIGRMSGSTTNRINGSIDEVMIFNRSLSSAEITEIYNSTYSRFLPTGTMLFEDLNFGTNNPINITIPNCQQLNGSQLSFKINDGEFSLLNSSCMYDNYAMTGDLTSASIVLKLDSGSYNFYSSLVVGNITLDSWFVNKGTVIVNFSNSIGTIKKDFYGVNTHGNWGSIGYNEGVLSPSNYTWHREKLLEVGITKQRIPISFSSSTGTTYGNARRQDLVTWGANNGISSLILINNMPLWLANTSANCWSNNLTCPPMNYTSYTALVLSGINNYTSNGLYNSSVEIEIYNEPDLTGFWMINETNRTASALRYLELYNATYLAIKEVYPDMKVYGPSVSNINPAIGGGILMNLFLINYGNQTDGISFHEYRSSVQENSDVFFKSWFDILQGNCTTLNLNSCNIYITEFNELDWAIINDTVIFEMQNALAYLGILNSYPDTSNMVYYQWQEDGVNRSEDAKYGMVAEPLLDNTVFASFNSTKNFATYHSSGSTVYTSTSDNNDVKVVSTNKGNQYAITIINADNESVNVTLDLLNYPYNNITNLETGELLTVTNNITQLGILDQYGILYLGSEDNPTTDAQNACNIMIIQFGGFVVFIGLLGTIILLGGIIFTLSRAFTGLGTVEGVGKLFSGLLVVVTIGILIIVALVIYSNLCELF